MGSLFSSSLTPPEVGDLTGTVILVTGGNSGIGFTAVQQLARKGAKVYMGARSEERAKAAIERLKAEGLGPGNGEVLFWEVNLSDPRKAKESAQKFAAKEKRLDVLVNNAALMRTPYVMGPDGIQDTMVVNLFSPFVFTRELLPLLTQTAREPGSDVRIVNVSSQSMSGISPGVRYRNLEDLNQNRGSMMQRYGYSKIATTLWTNHLQTRLDAENIPITVMSLHPGSVWTEGLFVKDPAVSQPIMRFFVGSIIKALFLTAEQGAYATVFAAGSPQVSKEREKYKGAFLMPGGKLGVPPNKDARDPALGKELWDTTEAVLAKLEI